MLLLALFVIVVTEARVFNVTYLSVPHEVPASQDEVEIECRYEGNFTLLNWFKGPNEFFRYKPGAAPSTRSFLILGVGRIELVICGPTVCRLRLGELTEEATGLYRCDIERDIVPFKFATKGAYMRVLGHVHRPPLLEGLATKFGEGDDMRAYCRADHYSEVWWYINGREIKDMRGSRTLKQKSSRMIFSGLPPTVTIQCAEMVNGKFLGSKEAKASWIEPMKDSETDQKTKNRASKLTLYNVLLVTTIKYYVL